MTATRLLIVLSCLMGLPACQSYSPSPLDLQGHHRVVAARDPSAADVVEYARRLRTGGPSEAGTYDPSDGLSLGEAELVALFFNPQLRIARLKADAARVGAKEAGRWQDPEFGFDAERIIESVQHPWVLAGTLGFTIPLSGRLESERHKAQEEASTEALRALAEERGVLAELRAQWVEWSAAVERAELTRRMIEQLDPLVTRADRLREAGELDPADARLLRLERSKQVGRLRGFNTTVRTAELRIKTRLGLAADAPVKFLPSLAVPFLPSTNTAEQMAALVMEHPRVRVVRAEYEVAERAFDLAIRKQYPDLSVGGGLGTDRGDNNVLFGLGIPLPLFNANRREIAEARAGREAARAAAQAEHERVLTELAAARARAEGARAQVEHVEQELAPLADQQVEDARRLGRAGVFNALLLLEAVKTAHEAKLEAVEARLTLGLAQREIEALLGPAGSLAGKDRP